MIGERMTGIMDYIDIARQIIEDCMESGREILLRYRQR